LQQQRRPQRPRRRRHRRRAGAIAGGTLGNAVDQQNGTIYRSEYEARRTWRPAVPPQPPPPAEYQTAQPTPSAIWVYGYYDYDGYRYLWVPGHWEIPPPDAVAFVRPHWRLRGGTYVYIAATGGDGRVLRAASTP